MLSKLPARALNKSEDSISEDSGRSSDLITYHKSNSKIISLPHQLYISDEIDPQLDILANEYYKLRTSKELDDQDINRLMELADLALVDDDLRIRMEQIDLGIDNLSRAGIAVYTENNSYMTINSYLKNINELKYCSSLKRRDIKSEIHFLSQQMIFTTEMIERYISFNQEKYTRKIIFSNDDICVYVISWLPGQQTIVHSHEYSFCSTFVYQGELTVKEYSSGEDTSPNNVDNYNKGDWFLSAFGQWHHLSNNSCENLVTIHYRYFEKSSQEYDNPMLDNFVNCIDTN